MPVPAWLRANRLDDGAFLDQGERLEAARGRGVVALVLEVRVLESLPDGEEGFTGADLRLIYNLLDHLDSSHFWRGLCKTMSPEGDILWLCPTHYKIFDPGLPKLSQ